MTHIDSGSDFCFLPGNDCDHTAMSNISVQGLIKDARRFKKHNIRVRTPVDALKGKPFRSNNNVPMGHRIY